MKKILSQIFLLMFSLLIFTSPTWAQGIPLDRVPNVVTNLNRPTFNLVGFWDVSLKVEAVNSDYLSNTSATLDIYSQNGFVFTGTLTTIAGPADVTGIVDGYSFSLYDGEYRYWTGTIHPDGTTISAMAIAPNKYSNLVVGSVILRKQP